MTEFSICSFLNFQRGNVLDFKNSTCFLSVIYLILMFIASIMDVCMPVLYMCERVRGSVWESERESVCLCYEFSTHSSTYAVCITHSSHMERNYIFRKDSSWFGRPEEKKRFPGGNINYFTFLHSVQTPAPRHSQ